MPFRAKAICGEFELVKKLKVFDFTTLNIVSTSQSLSHFDPDYGTKLSQSEFMKDFEQIISQPFSPEDTNLEYLPIQALTEYLSHELKIDAIIYSSAQRGMETNNIAILNPLVLDGENSVEANLAFKDGSLSIHEITAVEYKYSHDDLQGYIEDLIMQREITSRITGKLPQYKNRT